MVAEDGSIWKYTHMTTKQHKQREGRIRNGIVVDAQAAERIL